MLNIQRPQTMSRQQPGVGVYKDGPAPVSSDPHHPHHAQQGPPSSQLLQHPRPSSIVHQQHQVQHNPNSPRQQQHPHQQQQPPQSAFASPHPPSHTVAQQQQQQQQQQQHHQNHFPHATPAHSAQHPQEINPYFASHPSPYNTQNPTGGYSAAETPELMAAAHMTRPYPPIYQHPQTNPPAAVPSPAGHDQHGRSIYGQPSQMPQGLYGYAQQYQSMQPSAPQYGHQPPAHQQQHHQQHQPQQQQQQQQQPSQQQQHHQLTSQPLLISHQQNQSQLQHQTSHPHPHQHPHQHPQPHPHPHPQQTVPASPRQKIAQSPMQRPLPGPVGPVGQVGPVGPAASSVTTHSAPSATAPSSNPMQGNAAPGAPGAPGVNPNAAPGPIPATTPLVVRQDNNGVQWIAFEYSRDRIKMEYTIRCDVESVNVEGLSQEFKTENCVYPRACCAKEQYRGNRLVYETECNTVGWALAELNASLRGKRGLIQRAVDSWRNSNQDPRLRSRRVRRMAKMTSRSKAQSSSAQQQHPGQMAGPSGPGAASASAPTGVPPPTMKPVLNMGGQQLHHHHAHPDGGAPGAPDDVSANGEFNDGQPHHGRQAPNPSSATPSSNDARHRQIFHGYGGAYPTSHNVGGAAMPPLTYDGTDHLGAPHPSNPTAIATSAANDFGDVRARIRSWSGQVEPEQMPDLYRKTNHVSPQSTTPVNMHPSSMSSMGRGLDGRDENALRTQVSVSTLQG